MKATIMLWCREYNSGDLIQARSTLEELIAFSVAKQKTNIKKQSRIIDLLKAARETLKPEFNKKFIEECNPILQKKNLWFSTEYTPESLHTTNLDLDLLASVESLHTRLCALETRSK